MLPFEFSESELPDRMQNNLTDLVAVQMFWRDVWECPRGDGRFALLLGALSKSRKET